MGSAHYALSEFFIVVAVIACLFKLVGDKLWLGAAGTALFGLIAAIGAYRYGMNQVDALKEIHVTASRVGGGIALTLVAAQFSLLTQIAIKSSRLKLAVYSISALIIIFTVTLASLRTAIALVSMLIPIAVTVTGMHKTVISRIINTALVSVFPLNFLLVRRSPLLELAQSWHLYHVLIAVWLLGITWVLQHALKAHKAA